MDGENVVVDAERERERERGVNSCALVVRSGFVFQNKELQSILKARPEARMNQ